MTLPPAGFIFRHPLLFAGRVLRSFQTNQGILLAGAVAYYALLSLVPLVILLLVALSHVVEPAQLMTTLQHYLERLVPGESELILAQVAQFLGQRRALSGMLIGALLFFSSLAFGVLENAMATIFVHRRIVHQRHALTSLLLPYLYMLLLGFGLLIATLLNGTLQTLATTDIQWLGWRWPSSNLMVTLLYLIGLLSQIGILTLIYMLMPVGRLPLRHALVGGIAAALLWEGGRYGLVWYFTNLSLVNVVYGSLTGVIVALLTLEAASIIILLGAQVIAEYERLALESEADSASGQYSNVSND